MSGKLHELPDELRGWYDTDKHIYNLENKPLTVEGLTPLQQKVITNAPDVLYAGKNLVEYLRLPFWKIDTKYLDRLDILLDTLDSALKDSEDLSEWNLPC